MENCPWFYPPTVRFMRGTQQPVLRKFWHAVMPLSALADGPQLVTQLGESIVLFLNAEGAPAALPDRCCHRIAKRQLEAMTNGSVAIKYNVKNL